MSSPTIARTDTSLAFWVETVDDGYTKAVKLELSDVSDGILVKATQARYLEGSLSDVDWNTTGSTGSVATSETAGGYGISSLTAVDAGIPASARDTASVQTSPAFAASIAETGDPNGNLRDITLKLAPLDPSAAVVHDTAVTVAITVTTATARIAT